MISGAMSDAKRRNGQRLALGLAGLTVVWLLGVWPPPVWWRSHWPRCTAMMRLRRSDGRTVGRQFPRIAVRLSDRPTVRPEQDLSTAATDGHPRRGLAVSHASRDRSRRDRRRAGLEWRRRV